MPLNDVTVARSNSKYQTTMSEVQENSVLSSQSGDTIDSFTQDANGELVMSKSKARSLRRKRAKQRKKELEMTGEKKAEESQDKENDATPLAQESQAAKKKKRSRKKKTTTNGVEQPKTAAQNGIPNVNTEVEKPKPEASSKTDITSTVKKSSPVMREPSADSVETLPTSVYEDDNEHKDRTKEDCACACIIS